MRRRSYTAAASLLSLPPSIPSQRVAAAIPSLSRARGSRRPLPSPPRSLSQAAAARSGTTPTASSSGGNDSEVGDVRRSYIKCGRRRMGYTTATSLLSRCQQGCPFPCFPTNCSA
uniref:Uncharacterized protein n=1 Tax=Leersia perrieri TaxID=77586 RepID=A0A0D9WE93_9ORYZ